MKTRLTLLALSISGLMSAQASLYDYDWNSGFDRDGAVPGDETPWWDTRTLSGLDGRISDIRVRLQLTEDPLEGNNGDLYAYLVHGNTAVVLLNRVGRSDANPDGYLHPGFNVVFSDAAATDVHWYDPLGTHGFNPVTGTYQPDGRQIDPGSAGGLFDGATRQNDGLPLGLFQNLDPNGDWTLVLSDHGAAGLSTVQSWGMTLDITPVPEPGQTAAGAALVCMAAVIFKQLRRRRVQSRIAGTR